jgi:glycosyltransferase involved in cell wall biosynthesis
MSNTARLPLNAIRSMNILNINLGQHEAIAGTEKAFLDYGRALKDLDQNIHYIVLKDSPLAVFLEKNHLSFDALSWPALPLCWMTALFIQSALKKFHQILNSFQPHMILIHERHGCDLLKKSSYNGPCLGIEHNYNKKKYGLHSLGGYIGVSESVKEYWVNLGWNPQHFHVIPNMADSNHTTDQSGILLNYLENNTANHSPQKTDSSSNHLPLRIGIIGRFSWMKGFDVWVDALHLLHQKGIPFQAIIAGERPPSLLASFLKEPLYTWQVKKHGLEPISTQGSYKSRPRRKLESQIKKYALEKKISFLGWVSQDVFFSNIDILCIPSLQESFGLVFFEAAQRHKPIIATTIGGLKDLGIHGQTAHMIPAKNPKSLADALEKLIADPFYRLHLAQGAFADLENYHPQIIGKKILQIIDLYCHNSFPCQN